MKNSLLDTQSLLLSLSCLFLVSVAMQAQERSKSTVTVNTDLVVTWVQAITSTDKSPVKGLSIDDLTLHEEGKLQKISFVKEGQPLSVVILVDGMTCVRMPEIELQRSREALRQLGEDAEIALMAWDSDVRLVQPLTRNQQLVADQLGDRKSFFIALNGEQTGPEINVRPGRDSYRPGEAIYQATQYLAKAASPERRKVIIVITQSFLMMAKRHSHSALEVDDLLKKTGTTVYALLENNGKRSGYGGDQYNPVTMIQVARDKQRRQGGGSLEDFVALTGGSIFVSKNEVWQNLNRLIPNGEFGKEFDELFIKLTQQIRSSYTIGYYPENTNFDGQFRRFTVELSQSGKTKAGKADIKAREGYFAIRPEPVAGNVVTEKQR